MSQLNNNLSGLIIVDKPKGVTSFSVVNSIRKIIGIDKIGHTGTLDPLATGVLAVCIGEATKIANLLMGQDKIYDVKVKLGERTDTLDADGTVIQSSARNLEEIKQEELLKVIEKFTGDIFQIPPMYSAVKQNGKPLHELARLGKEVEREKRKVNIDQIQLLSFDRPYLELRVSCSKGTYVRTLADDIGVELKTYAHVVELRRVKNGVFNVKDAVSLSNGMKAQDVLSKVIPLESVLSLIMPVREVDRDTANKIALGYKLDLNAPNMVAFASEDKKGNKKLVSINIDSKIFRVFNYQQWV